MKFRILGPLEVTRDGVPAQPRSPKQRALLGLLLLEANRVVSVDTLVEALWAGDPPTSAVNVLRTYVSHLRRALEPDLGPNASPRVLLTRPPGYVLRVTTDQLDTTRFEEVATSGRAALAAGDPRTAAARLREALTLWRGPLLADLGDKPFVGLPAAQWEERRLAVLEDRVDADLALGRHADLVAELESLVAEHPLRERLWGQLILGLYRSARQADALRAYGTVRARLVEELGVEPGPELRELERSVLHQSPDLAWTPPSGRRERAPAGTGLPPALARGRPETLVGRQAELLELEGHWKGALDAGLGAAFVAGPPGIGKSSLASEFAARVWADGATVTFGRCDDASGAPYQAVAEAVGHLVRRGAMAFDALSPHHVGELARLVPDFAGPVAHPSEADPTESEGGRHRLFDAVAALLEAACSTQPVLVVLDDLQWADAPFCLLLRHLLRHPPEGAVLVLGCYRDTDLGGEHPLLDLLADVRGDERVARLELDGLSASALVDLLEAAAGAELSLAGRAFASLLQQRTQGNPLFVHESLRHLAESGVVAPAEGRWGSDRTFDDLGVPQGVKEVIGRRVSRLTDATRAVLPVAAVAGQEFDLRVVGTVVGLPDDSVVAALDESAAAGLVREMEGASDRYAFSHALVRETLQQALSRSRQARLHWAVGEAIEALHADDVAPHLSEIAYHLGEGVTVGDRRRFVEYGLRAGRHALDVLAFEEAAGHCSRVLAVLDQSALDEPESRYTALVTLGEARAALVDVPGLREAYRRAADVARDEGWASRLAHAARGFAFMFDPVDPDDEVMDVVEEALGAVGVEQTVDRCFLLSAKAFQCVASGMPRAARAASEDAVGIARRLGDPEALGVTLAARCYSLLSSPSGDELVRMSEEALAHGLVREGRVIPPVYAQGLAALKRGERTAFDEERTRVRSLADERRSELLRGLSRVWDACAALCDGRFDDDATLGSPVGGARRVPAWTSAHGAQVVAALIDQGDRLEALIPELETFVETAPPLSAYRAVLAGLELETGDRAAARKHLDLLQGDDLPALVLDWGAAIALRHLAEVCVGLGDTDLAAALLPHVSPYSGALLVSFSGVTVEAAADRVLAQLLLVLGRLDEAAARCEAARSLEESFGSPVLAARTYYWEARVLSARSGPGDRQSAEGLAERSLVEAEGLGMGTLARQAERLRGELSGCD